MGLPIGPPSVLPEFNGHPSNADWVRVNYLQRRDNYALKRMVVNANWVFPKRDEDRFGLYYVTYFFMAQSRPYWVKIGACRRLATRLGEHRETYGKNLTVIAAAMTPKYVELEAGLHELFAPFRNPEYDRSEWFDAGIVLTWLYMLEQQQAIERFAGPDGRF